MSNLSHHNIPHHTHTDKQGKGGGSWGVGQHAVMHRTVLLLHQAAGLHHLFSFCPACLPRIVLFFHFVETLSLSDALQRAVLHAEPSVFPSGLPSAGGLGSSCSEDGILLSLWASSQGSSCPESVWTGKPKGRGSDLCYQASTGQSSWEHDVKWPTLFSFKVWCDDTLKEVCLYCRIALL